MPTQTQPPPPTQPPRLRRWTRAEYDRMVEAVILTPEDRCELLEGEVVNKMPQGSRRFAIISLVGEALRAVYGSSHHVRGQGPLAPAGSESEPEPDVSVVRGRPLDYIDAHPTSAVLVVAVSDTSLEDDRTRKKRIYARAGITEYWIVNLAGECLEVHRTPSEDSYEHEETLTPPATVALPGADASVAVADLLP